MAKKVIQPKKEKKETVKKRTPQITIEAKICPIEKLLISERENFNKSQK